MNELKKQAHKTAKEKGFWSSMESVIQKMEEAYIESSVGGKLFTEDDLEQVKKAFRQQKLMLMVSELGEACECERKGLYSDWKAYSKIYAEILSDNPGTSNEEAFRIAFEEKIKDTLEDELADVVIRIFDFCGEFNIDLQKHIELKMKFNSTREKLHGKKF